MLDLPELLAHRIESRSQDEFLVDVRNDRVFSYETWHEFVSSIALDLMRRGIGRGDRVAFVLQNSAEFAALYFACLYLGITAFPINPLASRKDIRFLLESIRVKMLILSPDTTKLVDADTAAAPARTVCCLVPKGDEFDPGHVAFEAIRWEVPEGQSLAAEGLRLIKSIDSDSLFSVAFTSGTTSVPKGVPHRVDSLFRSAIDFNGLVGITEHNRFYHVLPLAYMAGFLNTLLCPFVAGGSVVLNRAFDARLALEFWSAARKHGANTMWLVPTILSSLLSLDRDKDGASYCREHVATICVGTAPLPLKLKRDFESRYGVALHESYGLSETLFVSANAGSVAYKPGSVGVVLPNVEVRIVERDGGAARPGVEGEVAVRTGHMMAGYLDYDLQQPDASTSPEWFLSGDIGYLDEDGYLFITGRKKDLIIRGGLNISPRSIEETILQCNAVAQVAVVGIPHPFYGEEVVAVLVLRDGYDLESSRKELESLCRESLSPMLVPTKYVEVSEMPTSSTGKIQKAKLRVLVGAGGALSGRQEGPA